MVSMEWIQYAESDISPGLEGLPLQHTAVNVYEAEKEEGTERDQRPL